MEYDLIEALQELIEVLQEKIEVLQEKIEVLEQICDNNFKIIEMERRRGITRLIPTKN
jgi:restriction endonuclease S subunit